MKDFGSHLVWVLVVGGVLWGYKGLTGVDFVELWFGLEVGKIINVLVGVAGLMVGYMLLTKSLMVKNK